MTMQAEDSSSQSMPLATYLAYANMSAIRLLAKLLVRQVRSRKAASRTSFAAKSKLQPSLQRRPDFQMLTLLLISWRTIPLNGRLN